MIVDTGPNGSTVVDRVVAHGSSVRSRTGGRKAPPGDRRLGVGIAGDDPRARRLELGDLRADVVALADG